MIYLILLYLAISSYIFSADIKSNPKVSTEEKYCFKNLYKDIEFNLANAKHHLDKSEEFIGKKIFFCQGDYPQSLRIIIRNITECENCIKKIENSNEAINTVLEAWNSKLTNYKLRYDEIKRLEKIYLKESRCNIL